MRRLAPVLTVLVTVVFLAVPARAEPTDSPSITASASAATIGQSITVTGRGFPPSTATSLQVCGNNATDGTTDCDVLAGHTVVTNEVGAFNAPVVVRFPPVSCPCVVWAFANGGASPASATTPIGVVTGNYTTPSLPTPIPSNTPTNTLEVLSATVHQHDAWQSWLGLPAKEELVLVVRNAGTTKIDRPYVALTLGRGQDPTQILNSPPLGALAPGEQETVTIPFDLGAMAHGSYTVKGSIASAAGDAVAFRAPVSAFPWLLPLIGVLAALASVILIRRRQRTEDSIEFEEKPETLDEVASEPEPLQLEFASLAQERSEPVFEESPVEVEPDPEPEPELLPVIDLRPEPQPVIEAAEPPALPPPPPSPTVCVTFTYPSWVAANSVALCGDFNDWSVDAHAMTRLDDGEWRVDLQLETGQSYRYRFLVDGDRWDDDWTPDAYIDNAFGSKDSLVLVGYKDRYANLDAERLHRTSTTAPRPTDEVDVRLVPAPAPAHNGNGNGNVIDSGGDDDWAAAFSAPTDDFWAETPDPLMVRLRRWRP